MGLLLGVLAVTMALVVVVLCWPSYRDRRDRRRFAERMKRSNQ